MTTSFFIFSSFHPSGKGVSSFFTALEVLEVPGALTVRNRERNQNVASKTQMMSTLRATRNRPEKLFSYPHNSVHTS